MYWSALLTINGILLTFFSIDATSESGTVLIFYIILISSTVLSIWLILFNLRQYKRFYFKLGRFSIDDYPDSPTEQIEFNYKAEEEGLWLHYWINFREVLVEILLVFETLLVVLILFASKFESLYLNFLEWIDMVIRLPNTREYATITWVFLMAFYFLRNKKVSHAFRRVLFTFLQKSIIKIYIVAIAYFILSILLLAHVGYWDSLMIKDSITWGLFTSFSILMGLKDAIKDKRHFQKLIVRNFEIGALVIFVSNTVVFSYWVEFTLIGFMTFLVLLEVATSSENEYTVLNRLLNGLIFSIGGVFIIKSIFTLVGSSTDWLFQSKLFLLPLVLTILFIPCAYLIAFYMHFEQIAIRLRAFLRGNINSNYAYFKLLLNSRLSLKRLRTLSQKVNNLHVNSTKEQIRNTLSFKTPKSPSSSH